MYNSEKYIDGLLQTLQAQTFQDFCAVFVDDGSKDDTYQVLTQKLQNVNFTYDVIHQENKGLPGARNTGIRGSHSPWIVFMDSDDGLDSRYLEFLYRAVTDTGCNVAACGYQIVESEADARAIAETEYSCRALCRKDVIREYYTRWFGAWALILNRQWLDQEQLLFDEACTYLEDVPFITQVLVHAERTALMDAPVYLYYQRPGSLMHTPKIEKYQIALDGFARMEEKVRLIDNDAAREFASMGRARYYLATLRKAAGLVSYPQFLELCQIVPLEKEKAQFGNLQRMQKMAAYVYTISKRLFYHTIRLIRK
jgi:glycosyltransferase involved in cell wall biosynthesis